ncbi:hypothetical protein NMD1_01178 [Novosphingobium sp. MD-1]|nr:hypothetical protein NMD1_01178 [Novosphingobium sp. MD-1]
MGACFALAAYVNWRIARLGSKKLQPTLPALPRNREDVCEGTP